MLPLSFNVNNSVPSGRLTKKRTGGGEFRPGTNAGAGGQTNTYDYPQVLTAVLKTSAFH